MSTRETYARHLFRPIVADENGLRWKEKIGGEWQAAAWGDVADFYVEPPRPFQFIAVPSYVVRFHDGRTLSFSASWHNYRALAGVIASSARPETARRPDGTIGWEWLGTRPADLPASFTYSEQHVLDARKAIARSAWIRGAALLGGVVVLGLLHATSAMGGLIAPLLIPMMGELAHWPGAKQLLEVKRRSQLGERFEVTTEALTFWQNGEPVTIPWTEIVGYDEPVFTFRPKEDTVRIRTVTGKELTFTSQMQGAAVLARILSLHAREAVAYRRGKNDQDALGGVDIRWTGGDEGKGDRVFHQRTRTNRNHMILLWAVPLFQAVVVLLLMRSSLPVLLLMLCFLIFFFVLALPKTLRYFRDKVVVAKDHLRVIQNGKETILPWKEVNNLEVTPMNLIVGGKETTTGEYKSLLLTTNEYAYGNELPDLIRERMAWGRAEAERTAIAASDVAESAGEARRWSNDIPAERQTVRVER